MGLRKARSIPVLQVGREKGEPGVIHLVVQDGKRIVELVVSQDHGVIGQIIVPIEIGHGFEEVRLGATCIEVARIQKKHVGILLPDLPNDGCPRRQTPCVLHAIVGEFQGVTMMIVGMKHHQVVNRLKWTGSGGACRSDKKKRYEEKSSLETARHARTVHLSLQRLAVTEAS